MLFLVTAYGYAPPTLQYGPAYPQPIAFEATLSPRKELDQLVLEDLRNQHWNLSTVSGPPRAMPSELSSTPPNTRLVNPVTSPDMRNRSIGSLFNAPYIEGEIMFPYLENVTSIVIPAQEASPLSSSSTSSTVTAHFPPIWDHTNRELTPNAENDPATDSLPLRKLSHGAWKCMVCDQKLRRKQMAIVHYWSKHTTLRLSCSGRCGSIDW